MARKNTVCECRRKVPFNLRLLSIISSALLLVSACKDDSLVKPQKEDTDQEKVTINIENKVAGQSKFITGLSHVDYTLRGGGSSQNVSAQTKAKGLLSEAIGMHATHIQTFGVASSWPDPDQDEPTVWWSLDQQMDLFWRWVERRR